MLAELCLCFTVWDRFSCSLNTYCPLFVLALLLPNPLSLHFKCAHIRSWSVSFSFIYPAPPISSCLHLHPYSSFQISCLFEVDSKFAILPPNIQPTLLNHINDSFPNRNFNYTSKRLRENIVVQLRGEPTTTANLSKGECSSVRRNGLCLCMCVCQCVIVWLCANVILSNLAVQTQVAQRVLKC